MAARSLRAMWTTPTHRCELWRVDGELEVRLYAGDRAIAIATSRDQEQASTLAKQWLEGSLRGTSLVTPGHTPKAAGDKPTTG
jgi:hypothetical protein